MAALLTSTSKPASTRSAKVYSCSRCFERKTRCDKQQPCTACRRSGHEDECAFRIPAKPRRTKKRTQEELLLARLRQCEELLKANGIPVPGLSPADDDAAPEQDASEALRLLDLANSSEVKGGSVSQTSGQVFPGRLYQAKGKTTFLENALFSSLNAELDQSEDVIPDSEDDEPVGTTINDPFRIDLVLGYTPLIPPTKLLHPRPEHIFKLWSIFQERVNPLSKIIHAPTVQNTLLDAAFNLDKIDRHFEALMFGIYATATLSLSDEDSEQLFGQERLTLFAHYLHGVRQTLVVSRFMGTADLTALQAFLLYIFATKMYYRPRTTWILAGIASRIAQGMGLHKDGSSVGLPIFESELRRRVWWQICVLDGRSAEMTGSGKGWDSWPCTVDMPLNIDDKQLFPGMTEPPQAQVGATEMTPILLRYELGSIRKKSPMIGNSQKFWMASPNMDIEQGEKLVSELQKRLEDKFLRYLNLSIPIHLLSSLGARVMACQMRMMVHHRWRMGGNNVDFSSLPLAEHELIWGCAIEVLECDDLCYTSDALRQFVWHTRTFFQWHPFIFVLTDLRTRIEGPEAERGWVQVENAFHNHPDFCHGRTRRPLYIAVGNLCLKAWNAWERALVQRNQALLEIPDYIQRLREYRTEDTCNHVPLEPQPANASTLGPVYAEPELQSWVSSIDALDADHQSSNNEPNGMTLTLLDTPMEEGPGPVDWTQWDALLQDFELPT